MRAVIQRVTRAAARVDGAIVGQITEPGLVVLVAVTHHDGIVQVEHTARKIADMRILHDERSPVEAGAPVLVISQFTLYADVSKGRRPTWNDAAPRMAAKPLLDALVDALIGHGLTVATGVFGAQMEIEMVADGPVTIVLESVP
ncbi:MAG: D-aminoacyl-tRNA deacylase [Micrococcales bacterium]|nr:D-aminoacyl-tRNA deacylase [Micrococcales bacterium]